MANRIDRTSSTGAQTDHAVRTRRLTPAPSREEVAAGQGLWLNGTFGPEVEWLQQTLNAAGFEVEVDGKLGPETEAALRQFQRRRQLKVDGKVGRNTLAALDAVARPARDTADSGTQAQSTRLVSGDGRRPTTQLPGPLSAPSIPRIAPVELAAIPELGTPSAPLPPGRADAPLAADRASREAQAESLLRANGQWPLREGRVYVVQIDEDSPPASAPSSDRRAWLNAYTGHTAVFKAVNGRLVEQLDPVRSSAHPGQMSAERGSFTSVDGDDRPDIAHLRSGVYEYQSTLSGGRFNPVSHRAMKVARDINHNGVIDGARENDPRFYATYLQIHAGGARGPSSVGCQNVAPEEWARFSAAVRGAAGREGFTYLLVRRDNERYGANPF